MTAMKEGSLSRFALFGFLIALALALFVSPFASPWPDGLERVAEDKGFIDRGNLQYFRAPIPDYLLPGIRQEKLATALAGGLGTVGMLAVGYGLGLVIRRTKGKEAVRR